MDEYYDGIRWNDKAFNIHWPDAEKRMISRKDAYYKDWIT
jgi:dTDP-4-dehydrorhamnose 3,5-epimerase-like enzyme